ncbi:MAG: sulfatase-like hydrolase/transferase [Victivallales bacterium]|jgi:arylsulfatase A-like enzyme|nr:sulfatase-like hydrolase/transferase [Victivallales bacterium]
MRRRTFLKTGVLATGSVLAAAPGDRPKSNLVFVNCDQLSYWAVAHGGKHVQMPNLRRLMARGVSFPRSYCAQPVCCPSRSSWFTGRMPSEHRVIGNSYPIRRELPNYGDWFREAGYEVVHVGKWHVPNRRPWDSGFKTTQMTNRLGEVSDAAVSRTCRAVLQDLSRETPFFLHVCFMNPHDICYPGMRSGEAQSLPDCVRNELPPLPPNFAIATPEPEAFVTIQRQHWVYENTKQWTGDDWRWHRYQYYRYCEMLDLNLGHLLDSLEMTGHTDDTVVVFTSDHGEGNAHHHLTQKASLYDEAARVPLIIAGPGLPRGQARPDALASGIDIFPTLCGLAGIKLPGKLTGLDLTPAVLGEHATVRPYVVVEAWPCAPDRGWAIISKRHKLIQYGNSPTAQLFDLLTDPWETRNLANKQVGILANHRAMLAEFQDRLDMIPLPEQGWPRWLRDFRKAHPDAKL